MARRRSGYSSRRSDRNDAMVILYIILAVFYLIYFILLGLYNLITVTFCCQRCCDPCECCCWKTYWENHDRKANCPPATVSKPFEGSSSAAPVSIVVTSGASTVSPAPVASYDFPSHVPSSPYMPPSVGHAPYSTAPPDYGKGEAPPPYSSHGDHGPMGPAPYSAPYAPGYGQSAPYPPPDATDPSTPSSPVAEASAPVFVAEGPALGSAPVVDAPPPPTHGNAPPFLQPPYYAPVTSHASDSYTGPSTPAASASHGGYAPVVSPHSAPSSPAYGAPPSPAYGAHAPPSPAYGAVPVPPSPYHSSSPAYGGEMPPAMPPTTSYTMPAPAPAPAPYTPNYYTGGVQPVPPPPANM